MNEPARKPQPQQPDQQHQQKPQNANFEQRKRKFFIRKDDQTPSTPKPNTAPVAKNPQPIAGNTFSSAQKPQQRPIVKQSLPQQNAGKENMSSHQSSHQW